MNTIEQYTVVADPETGEWLTTPQYVKDVDVAEWDKLEDTPQAHYDCYEEWIDDAYVHQSETRAIEMRWADYWWPSDGEVL
jgi:hypothetical protein